MREVGPFKYRLCYTIRNIYRKRVFNKAKSARLSPFWNNLLECVCVLVRSQTSRLESLLKSIFNKVTVNLKSRKFTTENFSSPQLIYTPFFPQISEKLSLRSRRYQAYLQISFSRYHLHSFLRYFHSKMKEFRSKPRDNYSATSEIQP